MGGASSVDRDGLALACCECQLSGGAGPCKACKCCSVWVRGRDEEVLTMTKLVLQSLGTFLAGAVALGLFIFLPAGTLNYWQAWVFIVVFLLSVNFTGIWLSLKDPALLERRKKFGPAQESSPAQKIIM